MKKLNLFTLLLVAQISLAQSSDLSLLKEEKRINLQFDYSSANINGHTEEEFAKIEADWYKDRPRYEGRFRSDFANTIKPKNVMLGDFADSKFTMKIVVEQVQKNGTVNATVEVLEGKNVVAKTEMTGKGGVFGTFLNLFGDGLGDLGKNIAKILKK